jgi:site-specific DNA-methyltransferase (adenine-specific)
MIALGDGIQGMASTEPGSISLVLSDLPSGATQAEFDVPPDLDRLWPAIWHCLKPEGVAVFMASSLRFAASLLASQERYFRYDLIWSKSLATGHLNAKRAPLRSHEYILVFSRVPGLFNPQMTTGASPIHAARRKSQGENYGKCEGGFSRAGATDRYPVSILEFASVGTSSPARKHPQQKPLPLLQWLIRTYTEPGDLVVDPFAGSGSTGQAAEAEGRSCRMWDSSPRFGSEVVA